MSSNYCLTPKEQAVLVAIRELHNVTFPIFNSAEAPPLREDEIIGCLYAFQKNWADDIALQNEVEMILRNLTTHGLINHECLNCNPGNTNKRFSNGTVMDIERSILKGNVTMKGTGGLSGEFTDDTMNVFVCLDGKEVYTNQYFGRYLMKNMSAYRLTSAGLSFTIPDNICPKEEPTKEQSGVDEKPKSPDEQGGESNGVEKTPDRPNDLIKCEVAIAEYNTTRKTIQRRLKDGGLTDYRPSDSSKNATYQLSRKELDGLFTRKK